MFWQNQSVKFLSHKKSHNSSFGCFICVYICQKSYIVINISIISLSPTEEPSHSQRYPLCQGLWVPQYSKSLVEEMFTRHCLWCCRSNYSLANHLCWHLKCSSPSGTAGWAPSTVSTHWKCLRGQEVTGSGCTCRLCPVRWNAEPSCDWEPQRYKSKCPLNLLCRTSCPVGPVPVVSLKQACRAVHTFSRCRSSMALTFPVFLETKKQL